MEMNKQSSYRNISKFTAENAKSCGYDAILGIYCKEVCIFVALFKKNVECKFCIDALKNKKVVFAACLRDQLAVH